VIAEDLMRRILLILVGLGAVVAGVLAFLPLAWVTDRFVPGLEATSVSGTIWDGQIRGARYQGVPIGDLDAQLALKPLLRGDAEIAWQRLGEPLAGRATLSSGVRRVSEVTGTVTLPVPLGGVAVGLALDGVTLETDVAGRCRAIEGVVTAQLGGLPVIGAIPPLSGKPRCDGEGILVPLGLTDNSIGLDLRAWRTGRWQADLAIRQQSPFVLGLLELAGFQRTADGALLRLDGRTRGP
jgi:general secretion pathway protein N